MGSYFRDFYAPKATQQPTIGDTKFSVIRQDHMGWLNCDGRLVSTEDYPLLFRVIEYSFGGSSNLFRLPDMRSAVPGAIGPGSNYNVGITMSNVSPRALGAAVGEETHLLTIAEMPRHTHGPADVTGSNNGTGYTTSNGEHTHITNATGGQGNLGLVTANGTGTGTVFDNTVGELTLTGVPYTLTVNSNGDHNHQIGNTGGDSNHNNMQPTVFIGNMFIYSGKIHGATSKWRYELDTNIL
jgi:microcystin-dependent protein